MAETLPARIDGETGEVLPSRGAVLPAMSIDEALRQWDQYQALKTKVGQPDDFQNIKGKMHPKKSFVRKAQRFFSVSCAITRDEPWRDEGKVIGWTCSVRATHQASGLYQEADGSCEFSEKASGQATLHNVRAHALTRAKNRAILDLVGFGEVSAEEIIEEKRNRRKPAPKEKPSEHQESTPPGKASTKTPEPAEDPIWPWKPHGGTRLSDMPADVLREAVKGRISALWRERIEDDLAVREGRMTPDALLGRWGGKDLKSEAGNAHS